MRRSLIALSLLVTITGAAYGGENWPEFRGPGQQGHSDSTGLPVEWSESTNVKFKTVIPGEGWSSPVVWKDQVWMTTATEGGHSLRAVCVERESGKIIHDLEVFRVEKLPSKNRFNSYASPSPVVEEGRVYVCFGSMGNAAIDTATGQVLWRNNELVVEHYEGPGSTPILYKNLYILNCDGGDVRYVAALDKNTGKPVWKTDRTYEFGFYVVGQLKKSFGTPIVVNVEGQDQLISVGTRRVEAYDPETGRPLWYVDLEGYAYSIAPRPVVGEGMVFICTGYNKADLLAVRLPKANDKGDLTKSHVVWKFTQGVPFKPSLLFHEGLLYFVSDNGIARCVEAKTGKQVWQKRIAGNYSASPTLADGKIYFFSEDPVATVIAPGREFRKLAENELEAGCLASPAVAGKALFVRTKTHLYRIEQ